MQDPLPLRPLRRFPASKERTAYGLSKELAGLGNILNPAFSKSMQAQMQELSYELTSVPTTGKKDRVLQQAATQALVHLGGLIEVFATKGLGGIAVQEVRKQGILSTMWGVGKATFGYDSGFKIVEEFGAINIDSVGDYLKYLQLIKNFEDQFVPMMIEVLKLTECIAKSDSDEELQLDGDFEKRIAAWMFNGSRYFFAAKQLGDEDINDSIERSKNALKAMISDMDEIDPDIDPELALAKAKIQQLLVLSNKHLDLVELNRAAAEFNYAMALKLLTNIGIPAEFASRYAQQIRFATPSGGMKFFAPIFRAFQDTLVKNFGRTEAQAQSLGKLFNFFQNLFTGDMVAAAGEDSSRLFILSNNYNSWISSELLRPDSSMGNYRLADTEALIESYGMLPRFKKFGSFIADHFEDTAFGNEKLRNALVELHYLRITVQFGRSTDLIERADLPNLFEQLKQLARQHGVADFALMLESFFADADADYRNLAISVPDLRELIAKIMHPDTETEVKQQLIKDFVYDLKGSRCCYAQPCAQLETIQRKYSSAGGKLDFLQQLAQRDQSSPPLAAIKPAALLGIVMSMLPDVDQVDTMMKAFFEGENTAINTFLSSAFGAEINEHKIFPEQAIIDPDIQEQVTKSIKYGMVLRESEVAGNPKATVRLPVPIQFYKLIGLEYASNPKKIITENGLLEQFLIAKDSRSLIGLQNYLFEHGLKPLQNAVFDTDQIEKLQANIAAARAKINVIQSPEKAELKASLNQVFHRLDEILESSKGQGAISLLKVIPLVLKFINNPVLLKDNTLVQAITAALFKANDSDIDADGLKILLEKIGILFTSAYMPVSVAATEEGQAATMRFEFNSAYQALTPDGQERLLELGLGARGTLVAKEEIIAPIDDAEAVPAFYRDFLWSLIEAKLAEIPENYPWEHVLAPRWAEDITAFKRHLQLAITESMAAVTTKEVLTNLLNLPRKPQQFKPLIQRLEIIADIYVADDVPPIDALLAQQFMGEPDAAEASETTLDASVDATSAKESAIEALQAALAPLDNVTPGSPAAEVKQDLERKLEAAIAKEAQEHAEYKAAARAAAEARGYKLSTLANAIRMKLIAKLETAGLKDNEGTLSDAITTHHPLLRNREYLEANLQYIIEEPKDHNKNKYKQIVETFIQAARVSNPKNPVATVELIKTQFVNLHLIALDRKDIALLNALGLAQGDYLRVSSEQYYIRLEKLKELCFTGPEDMRGRIQDAFQKIFARKFLRQELEAVGIDDFDLIMDQLYAGEVNLRSMVSNLIPRLLLRGLREKPVAAGPELAGKDDAEPVSGGAELLDVVNTLFKDVIATISETDRDRVPLLNKDFASEGNLAELLPLTQSVLHHQNRAKGQAALDAVDMTSGFKRILHNLHLAGVEVDDYDDDQLYQLFVKVKQHLLTDVLPGLNEQIFDIPVFDSKQLSFIQQQLERLLLSVSDSDQADQADQMDQLDHMILNVKVSSSEDEITESEISPYVRESYSKIIRGINGLLEQLKDKTFIQLAGFIPDLLRSVNPWFGDTSASDFAKILDYDLTKHALRLFCDVITKGEDSTSAEISGMREEDAQDSLYDRLLTGLSDAFAATKLDTILAIKAQRQALFQQLGFEEKDLQSVFAVNDQDSDAKNLGEIKRRLLKKCFTKMLNALAKDRQLGAIIAPLAEVLTKILNNFKSISPEADSQELLFFNSEFTKDGKLAKNLALLRLQWHWSAIGTEEIDKADLNRQLADMIRFAESSGDAEILANWQDTSPDRLLLHLQQKFIHQLLPFLDQPLLDDALIRNLSSKLVAAKGASVAEHLQEPYKQLIGYVENFVVALDGKSTIEILGFAPSAIEYLGPFAWGMDDNDHSLIFNFPPTNALLELCVAGYREKHQREHDGEDFPTNEQICAALKKLLRMGPDDDRRELATEMYQTLPFIGISEGQINSLLKIEDLFELKKRLINEFGQSLNTVLVQEKQLVPIVSALGPVVKQLVESVLATFDDVDAEQVKLLHPNIKALWKSYELADEWMNQLLGRAIPLGPRLAEDDQPPEAKAVNEVQASITSELVEPEPGADAECSIDSPRSEASSYDPAVEAARIAAMEHDSKNPKFIKVDEDHKQAIAAAAHAFNVQLRTEFLQSNSSQKWPYVLATLLATGAGMALFSGLAAQQILPLIAEGFTTGASIGMWGAIGALALGVAVGVIALAKYKLHMRKLPKVGPAPAAAKAWKFPELKDDIALKQGRELSIGGRKKAARGSRRQTNSGRYSRLEEADPDTALDGASSSTTSSRRTSLRASGHGTGDGKG